MEHLTQPSLLPTFGPEILLRLLKFSKDITTAVAYYHAVSPPLPLGSEVRTEYHALLARLHVQQAFFAVRGEPDERFLLETIVHSILGETDHQRRARMCTTLVDLPFTVDEESWFEEYLMKEKDTMDGANDILIMRKVVMGQNFPTSSTDSHLSARKIDGVDWNLLRNAANRARGSTKMLAHN